MNFDKEFTKKEDSGNLRLYQYAITGDPEETDDKKTYAPGLTALMQKIHAKIMRAEKGTEKELKQLIERYPDVPVFKNYLTVLYSKQGQYDKAYEVNHRIVAEHPDYLFGKINLAHQYLREKRYEEIPKILGEMFDLKELYPEREVFHINEFQSFWHIACLYFLETDNLEAVKSRLKMARDIHRQTNLFDEELLNNIQKAVKLREVQKSLERLEEQNQHTRTPRDRGYDIHLQTREAPVFHHGEIEWLYRHGLRIDHSRLAEILALPRETLVEDLQTVVKDAIRRYEFFEEQTYQWGEWLEEKLTFPLHAMFLLAELKAGEALPDILDFLRQGKKFLKFWLGDHLTGTVEHLIAPLAKDQLDLVRSFMLEPNLYTFSKCAVSAAVKRVAIRYPERRQEFLDWYRTIFERFLANQADEDLIDTDVISLMVTDCLDLRATELLPVIKQLWDQTLLSEIICGDWKIIDKDMSDPKFSQSMESFDTIFSHYQHILTTWYSYLSDEEKEVRERAISRRLEKMDPEIYQEIFEDDDDGEVYLRPQLPYLRKEKKVGRNDPCPCGSGKKYKKCCMQKNS